MVGVETEHATHATAGAPAPRRRRLLERAILALPAILLLERAWDRRWMTDDGFINLRVVRMILDGHGPVFNAGERVEVTTSPLWVWILTVGDVVLPLDLEWVAVVLGLVCAVGGLAFATYGAARLYRLAGATGPLVPAGAAVLAVLSPVWDFSTSGLEGGLTFGWLGLTGYLLARWAAADQDQGQGKDRRRLGAPSAALIGLGPLVRPDLALVSVAVLAGVLLAQWADDRAVDRVRLLASAGAVPVAYQVFRMGYFASLVPNTALAKSGGNSHWGRGFSYLRDLVQPYWLVLPLVALLAAVLVPTVVRALGSGNRRVAVGLAGLPVGGLLHGLYVVRVGGDYMHGRLLLPSLFALLVPVAAVPLRPLAARPEPEPETLQTEPDGAEPDGTEPGGGRRIRPRDAVTGGAVVATLAWTLVCLASLRPGSSPVVDELFSSDARAGSVRDYGEHAVTADDHGWGPDSDPARLAEASTVLVNGRPLAVDPPPDLPTPASAGFGVGISGYVYGTDYYIIDLLGLADPVTGRFVLTRPGAAGHEKPMPGAWLAARISTGPVDPAAMPRPVYTTPLWESAPENFDADTAAARAVLECGDVRDVFAAVRDPLTPGRFLSNIVDAPRYTRLLIPPDPQAARQRFCED